jgi:RNase H-fold protein (predicted Holliday junction resolvase)
MEPEFMTSAQAERVEFRRPDRDMNRVMARTGAKPNRKVVKNKKLDASAAALILKSFLDRHTNL